MGQSHLETAHAGAGQAGSAAGGARLARWVFGPRRLRKGAKGTKGFLRRRDVGAERSTACAHRFPRIHTDMVQLERFLNNGGEAVKGLSPHPSSSVRPPSVGGLGGLAPNGAHQAGAGRL